MRKKKSTRIKLTHAWLIASKCVNEWNQISKLNFRFGKIQLRNSIKLKYATFTKLKINTIKAKIENKKFVEGQKIRN